MTEAPNAKINKQLTVRVLGRTMKVLRDKDLERLQKEYELGTSPARDIVLSLIAEVIERRRKEKIHG